MMRTKKMRNSCIFLLFLMVCLQIRTLNVYATMYENPDNKYIVIIEDNAGLLEKDEINNLTTTMKELTKFGNVALVTIDKNATSAKRYANERYDYLFGNRSDGTLILIDMKNREIVLVSEGRVKQVITNSIADVIMDNVYKFASKQDYYTCANTAFLQVYQSLNDEQIPMPMKKISNALLALTCGVLINYWIVRSYTKKLIPKVSDSYGGITKKWKLGEFYATDVKTVTLAHSDATTHYGSLVDSESGGGGYSGSFGSGGSSGGSSGGGSSHSSGSHGF